ncbi:MAG: protease complex subunit PrcB family protein [Gemmatimonadaceae bacterium]
MLIPQPALALITAVVLAAPGCNQPSPTSATPPDASTVNPVQQTVTHLITAPTSGFMEGEELVIRSDAELTAAWKNVHAGIPGNPAPAIDLAHNMVVLLALGQRRTGGYTVRFDNITRDGTGAVVHYTVTSPGPGCMTTQMITSPIDVVSVPSVAGAVRFERSEVTDRC